MARVTDLDSDALDLWVARALGEAPGRHCCTDWSVTGPIIERERISLAFNDENARWYACSRSGREGCGETMIEAAMRAFVASKFGEHVPDA